MRHLRLIGITDGNPANITVDTTSPYSFVSEAFLFQNNINPILDKSGRNHRRASLSVPSVGGYYTSHEFCLVCSVTCKSDVVLGADWVSKCRPVLKDNTFGQPSPETIRSLTDGHTWIANGMQFRAFRVARQLTCIVDTFLPFSLLHARRDQYRFSQGLDEESPMPNERGGVFHNSETGHVPLPGYHDQIFLDVSFKQTFSNPPNDDNVTRRDPIRDPIYNHDLIFDLIRNCMTDEPLISYSRIVLEHNVSPPIGTADGVRAALLHHLFSGGCVVEKGTACKDIVHGEEWPQSFAIRIIDLVSEWVDSNKLATGSLIRMCRMLGFVPSATSQRRSSLSKLAAHRRSLVKALDMANLSVKETFHNLGSSSTLDTIRGTCMAHNVAADQSDEKQALIHNVVEHLTHGNCAETVAPGCDHIMKEVSPSLDDVIHTQVGVLQCIQDVLSTRQLQKILDLHGVDYAITDNKKRLKSRLKKYIRILEVGKVKDADAEHERMERLQKHEEIRKNWPKLVPPQLKEKLIKDFRNMTSSATLSTFTCSCCARELSLKERQRKAHTEIDIDILSAPDVHWSDSDATPPPTPFSTGPLANKLLDVNGVTKADSGTYYLDICTSCLRSLRKNSMPKHSLANRLYLGPIPDELRDLTMVEECMIARARAKSWIVKLQETDTESTSQPSQRGLKGHTIIYPQQPEKLATVLPPPIDEALTFICIVFVGSTALTADWLRTKAKPLVVRREKIYKALVWLKQNNPLYKDVGIEEENLRSLPDEDVLPYHIEHIPRDDAQDTLISRYDNLPDLEKPSSDQTHFESVVVSDIDAHTPPAELTAAAIHHVKTKGRRFIQIGHGSGPMNEFFNVNLFPMLYPTLFPYGCGGFEDRERCKAISLKEHVKYLFSLKDRRFQKHYSFLFVAFNILQRRDLLLHASLKVRKSYFAKFAKEFSNVSSDAISGILQRLEKGERLVAETDEERRVLRLMKEVNLVTSKVPGSSASRVAMRNEIRALTMTHGMPSFYITINPADTHNPIVKFLSEGDIDIDRMLEDEIPKFWEQSILVSSNPAIGAKFFNIYLKAFIRAVLGENGDETNLNGGILGTIKAHYGCVEAQGRGSLHCHMLIWIEGALNPNEIRESVIKDPHWGRRLLEYLDDTITNVVPMDPTPDASSPMDNKHPCSLRGPDLGIDDIDVRLAMRMKDLHRLTERVQRHHHTHTCYKYYKPGEARSCRFDLKEENFRAESSIDPETGNVWLRCLDGLVNNFNATILEAVRNNMDIQFIGSGESAKAMIYYITDYITKSQLKSHVAYAALQLAVKKCEQIDDGDDDFVVKSKRLLQRCAYAMISHQEMSAQQVASYLMDYEDHFTSHTYSNLYWPSFERLVDRDDPIESDDANNEADGPDGSECDDDVSEGEEEDTGDRDAPLEMDDQEEVSISITESGNVTELADQVSDYTLRPEEVSDLCLWDFIAKTEKVSGRRTKNHEETKTTDPEEGDDNSSTDSDDDSDDDIVEKPTRGRKKIVRYGFLAGHKECDRKFVRLRKYDVVPVPIGPGIPRRDSPEVYARYCRLMLILFKAWRQPSDLRTAGESWEGTYNDFEQTIERRHGQIINNMQILHECRDSRDDHMQTRPRQRVKNGSTGMFDDGGPPGNELEDIDMTEVIEHLSEIDRMSSRRTDTMKQETKQCLQELERAGWYQTGENMSKSRNVGDGVGLTLPDSDYLEDEWKDKYESRKAAWKVKTRQTEVEDGADTAVVGISKVEYTQTDERGDISISEVRSTDDQSTKGDTLSIIAEVVQKWTLNVEQRRAFEIVANHTTLEKPNQLLMYLGGPGGTGKSRVVNALRDFFGLRSQARRFRLAAYTGVAARNIGGATLHALLQMNESGRQLSAKGKRELAAMWDGVEYLFVDEVSMIGCEFLHNISRALTEAKGKTTAFGGVNVIFAGDFAQLPPIGDIRLYKNMDTSNLSSASTNRAQAKVLGKLLWLSVETVVILHKTMRQTGSENEQFVDLLQRLRSGVCTNTDYGLLKSRLLRNADLTVDDQWRAAPIIVTNNAMRDAINVRATEAFAERTRTDLHWYHAVDTHKKSVITDRALIENLESQHSGQTKHRLRRIPLVIGMPVSINQNFDVSAGVVNGSWGYLRGIRYSCDDEGRRYLKSCVVEIPGADPVEMAHLGERHFPILPDVTEIKFEHNASHKRCVIKRKQVPIEPGFAITAHKAQGQTMGRVVVDLAGCSGTESPYVMVSRSTSLTGLIVLRDFESGKIMRRHSEDLRKEFKRLECLRLQTVMKIGSESERHDAKQMLAAMQTSGEAKKRKALADESGERPKKTRLAE